MLNLKYDNQIKPSRNQLGDQGFINELYLWERLDLGLEHNTIVHLLQVDLEFFNHLNHFILVRMKTIKNTQRISVLSFIILLGKSLNLPVRQLQISGIHVVSMTNIQRS